jgi:hypothetical protein
VGCDVYANDNAVSCKAGDGKAIAAFPDVCLSPPSPPAGPVPVPYPNTSFDKDMQNGSKTVMIKGQEVMLKDQSFYKTSPLGDEAATNSFGASVVTHVITGKTYFLAWSMDVQFEGQNVDRNLDITGSNCASPPSTPPDPATIEAAKATTKKDVCTCCTPEHPKHSAAPEKTQDEWYTSDKNGNPLPDNHPQVKDYKKLMADVQNRSTASPPCTCNKPITPSPPCNTFHKPTTKDERDKIKSDWKKLTPAYQYVHGIPTEAEVTKTLTAKLGRAPIQDEIQDERQVNHLTPKSAGGCTQCEGNLQPNGELCGVCRKLDKRFGKLQDKAVQ